MTQRQVIGSVDVAEAARRMTGSQVHPADARRPPTPDTAGPGTAALETAGPGTAGLDTAGPGTAAPVLVDVREVYEFRQLRVPGAVLVPLSEFATAHTGLPKDRPLLVMCASGKRSLVAAEFLSRNGYPDVANVEGGIIAWHGAGLPTTDGPPAPGEGDLPAG